MEEENKEETVAPEEEKEEKTEETVEEEPKKEEGEKIPETAQETEEKPSSEASPVASSAKEVITPSVTATESVPRKQGRYSKQYLLDSDNFVFLDRVILSIIMPDNAKTTLAEARKMINDYKGAE